MMVKNVVVLAAVGLVKSQAQNKASMQTGSTHKEQRTEAGYTPDLQRVKVKLQQVKK